MWILCLQPRKFLHSTRSGGSWWWLLWWASSSYSSLFSSSSSAARVKNTPRKRTQVGNFLLILEPQVEFLDLCMRHQLWTGIVLSLANTSVAVKLIPRLHCWVYLIKLDELKILTFIIWLTGKSGEWGLVAETGRWINIYVHVKLQRRSILGLMARPWFNALVISQTEGNSITTAPVALTPLYKTDNFHDDKIFLVTLLLLKNKCLTPKYKLCFSTVVARLYYCSAANHSGGL